MKKIALISGLLLLVASVLTWAPQAEACDAAQCEEVTGCYGCYWYGVLFINCHLGGCNSCGTSRCESFALNGSGDQDSSLASQDSPASSLCGEDAEAPPPVEVLKVEVLPART